MQNQRAFCTLHLRRAGRSFLKTSVAAPVFGIVFFIASSAQATYSIVGVDTQSQQVGGAGTSCVPFDVAVIYASAPGLGVVHAQAQLNQNGRDEAQSRLQQGEDPSSIMAVLSSNGFDGNHPRRQYLAVDLMGRSAAYTGAQTGSWSGDLAGSDGAYHFVAAGNILTGPEVVDDTAAGFATGCDLADRLMNALEQGRSRGGDSRCTPDGRPADSAFIRVDLPGEAGWLSISRIDTGPADPVSELRTAYDAWRVGTPCPEPPDAGFDAGGFEDAETDATTDTPDFGTPDSMPADAIEVADRAQPADTGTNDDATAADAIADSGRNPRRVLGGGCGCNSHGGPRAESGLWLWFYLLPLGRRPRPKASLRKTNS